MIQKGDIFMKDISDGIFPNFPEFQKEKYIKDREKLLNVLNTTVIKFQQKWNLIVFVEVGENILLKPIEIPRVCVNIP